MATGKIWNIFTFSVNWVASYKEKWFFLREQILSHIIVAQQKAKLHELLLDMVLLNM